MKKFYLLAAVMAAGIVSAQSWVPQGTNWSPSWGVKEIVIVDANTAWITSYDGSGGGSYPKDFARTIDGGNTWIAMNAEEIPSGALISDIAAIDANTAYVVTAPHTSGVSNNGIWKTTDGGVTWVKYSGSVFSASASFANHIYFWDANNGYAGGDPVSGKFEMYSTTDGGATWNVISTAPAPLNANEFTYVGHKKIVGDNIWLGTSLGRILRSTDRGATWTAHVSPANDFGGVITDGSFGVYAFADGNNGILITNDNEVAFMYVTNDGGVSWNDITPTGNWYPGDITHVPGTANTYVSSGIDYDHPTGTSYSLDGGLTWIDIDRDEGGLEQRGRLEFLNGSTGWCGGFSDGVGGSMGIFKFDGALAVTDASTVKTNLQAYPNPSSTEINFSAKKQINMVSFIDMTGKVVSQTKATKVNVSSLPAGVYVAQVKYADGSVENTKVVVK